MKINIAHHFICLYRLHYSFCTIEYYWQACHIAVFYRAKFLGFRVLCCINPYYEKRIEIHKHGIIIPYQLDKNDNITKFNYKYIKKYILFIRLSLRVGQSHASIRSKFNIMIIFSRLQTHLNPFLLKPPSCVMRFFLYGDQVCIQLVV